MNSVEAPYSFVVNFTGNPVSVKLPAARSLDLVFNRLLVPLLESDRQNAEGILELNPERARRTLRHKLTLKNWRNVCRDIEVNYADTLECRLTLNVGRLIQPEVSLCLEARPLDESGVAHQIWFAADPELYAQLCDFRLADEVVSAAKQVAIEMNAVTGAVGRTAEIRFSSHESTFERGFIDVLRDCGRYVRGIYPGLILGPEQLQRLGGRNQVLAAAGVTVDDLSRTGHEMLYIGLADLESATYYAGLDALLAFLKPIIKDEQLARTPAAAEFSEALRLIPQVCDMKIFTPPPRQDGEVLQSLREAENSIPVQHLRDWMASPDVGVTLVLREKLEVDQIDRLEELLSAWYLLGETGAFGGWFHDMTKVAYCKSRGGQGTAEFWVDFGRADIEAATEALRGSLNSLVADVDFPLERLIFGQRITD